MDDIPFDIPADAIEADLLEELNESQREAVLAFDGPVLILAGAGTGKTRTIIHKMAYLVRVRGLAPWHILAMTFTNKAAGEMRERLRALLGPEDAGDLNLGTFHSIGVRLLRRYGGLIGLDPGFVIYDDGDQKTLLGRILKEMNLSDGFPVQRIRSFIDRAKNHCMGPDDPRLPLDGHFEEVAADVYAVYQKRLRAANAVDFGDLIVEVIRLLEEQRAVQDELHYRFKYVLVDELQDTNLAQHRLLKLLVSDSGGLCVVGDDDQSIYRWRGAEIANILRFEHDYPGTHVVRLERNYRSTANILEAAGAVIAHNRARHPKTLWTETEPGPNLRLFVAATEREEAQWVASQLRSLQGEVPLNEMAVFYRTNAQSRVFEDELRKVRLPYRVVGGQRFYERAEVKDALAYLRLLVNPRDDMAVERIINVPARGIGGGTVEKVRQRARESGAPLLETAMAMAEDAENAVRKRLRPFAAIMRDLRELVETVPPPAPIVVAQRTLERSGLSEALRAEGTIEAQSRLENLRELLDSIEEFEDAAATGEATLQGFLDQVALVASTETVEGEPDTVTLMTVHAAKGLEFEAVFLAGMEESILPHFNSLDDRDSIEEERRLCYVAMTRARRLLTLTRANVRRRFGQMQDNDPSRFLSEIPRHLLDVTDPTEARLRGTIGRGLTGTPGARFSSSYGHREQQAARSYQRDDGLSVDHDYDQRADSTVPGPGTRVRHPKLGEGRIVSIDGMGQDARVKVSFPDLGTRTIVARYLVLG